MDLKGICFPPARNWPLWAYPFYTFLGFCIVLWFLPIPFNREGLTFFCMRIAVKCLVKLWLHTNGCTGGSFRCFAVSFFRKNGRKGFDFSCSFTWVCQIAEPLFQQGISSLMYLEILLNAWNHLCRMKSSLHSLLRWMFFFICQQLHFFKWNFILNCQGFICSCEGITDPVSRCFFCGMAPATICYLSASAWFTHQNLPSLKKKKSAKTKQ